MTVVKRHRFNVRQQHDAAPTAGAIVVSGMPDKTTGVGPRSVLDAVDVVVRVRRFRDSKLSSENEAESGPKWDNVSEEILPPALGVPVSSPDHVIDLLQQFEGRVNSTSGQEFVARLRDLTDPKRCEEEMAFDTREVSEGDLPLLVPGAVFRWNIGYRTTLEGQRERISYFRFTRLPGWRRSIVESIERETEVMMRRFAPDEERSV